MAQDFAKAFYKSKVWRQQRRFALHRDSYECQDCHGRAMEVHHIVELTASNIIDNRIALGMDNLVSLCFDCHRKRHASNQGTSDGYVFNEEGLVVRDRAREDPP